MAEKTRASVIAQLTATGQPFELIPGQVFGRECLRFKNAPATLHDLFADARSDAPFIVYNDERMSFAETYAAAARPVDCVAGSPHHALAGRAQGALRERLACRARRAGLLAWCC